MEISPDINVNVDHVVVGTSKDGENVVHISLEIRITATRKQEIMNTILSMQCITMMVVITVNTRWNYV
jgi:hypothetical protein